MLRGERDRRGKGALETFLSYLMFSISEMPIILRMVIDHPYGSRDMLRV